MADQGDWRSEAFRRKVITQIEEALRSSNTPMTKSSQEMENHVYHKAKSREEYLALVARLILHVKDFNNQRREKALQQQQQQQQTGMPGPGGMVQGPGTGGMVQGPGGMGPQIATGSGGMVQGPGGMVQGPGGGGMVQGPGGVDPINALQNMTMSGAGMGPGVQQPAKRGLLQQGSGRLLAGDYSYDHLEPNKKFKQDKTNDGLPHDLTDLNKADLLSNKKSISDSNEKLLNDKFEDLEKKICNNITSMVKEELRSFKEELNHQMNNLSKQLNQREVKNAETQTERFVEQNIVATSDIKQEIKQETDWA